jgi:hypothetical protein
MEILTEILQSMEFEDDGWLRISSLVTSDRSSTLNVSVHTGQEEEPIQLWQVTGTNTEGYHIDMETCYDIEIVKDHPILWHYNCPTIQLYFNGSTLSPERAIVQLYERHLQLTGTWIPFHRYFNPEMSLRKLLISSHGMLARGPKILLKEYADIIITSGITVSTTAEKKRLYWNGEARVPYPEGLKAVIIGNSYIVAEKFEVQRIDALHNKS